MKTDQLFTRANVLAAAQIWDDSPGYGGFRQSNQNDVVINGKHYPPKAIIAIALECAGRELLHSKDFGGRMDGPYIAELRRCGFEIFVKGSRHLIRRQLEDDIKADITALIRKNGATEGTQEILSRIGQGQFRAALMDYWGGKCALTGIDCSAVLRASHIKRWADCRGQDEHHRLSAENGILLCANLDCLFEIGLIGFSDDGSIVLSSDLTAAHARSLGVKKTMKLSRRPTKQQCKHLAEHRARAGLPD